MPSLDQIESFRQVDKSGMGMILEEFPQRAEEAFASPLPAFNFSPAEIRSVAVVGLGGSAISGDLASSALEGMAGKPIATVRSAILPAWADKDTLVIAVSYSGNTAEVLAAYEEARQRRCPVVAVASGGKLAEYAARDHMPWVAVGASLQPRLAVGDLTAAVMKIAMWVCGISWEDTFRVIVGALGELQPQLISSVPTEQNPAKLLAYKLFDHLPVVAGGGVMAPVARRWKTQMNENAKLICIAEGVPELFHNTIEGLKNPLRIADNSIWILLEALDDPAVPAGQLDKLSSLLESSGIRVERVKAPLKNETLTGQAPAFDLCAAQWRLLYLGDWVSYYLAILDNVDPMPVETIQAFKSGQ